MLLTGGAGRLGRELTPALEQSFGFRVKAPPRSELDITNAAMVTERVIELEPTLIINAAAFTDVAAAETSREEAWRVNVVGARNLIAAARATSASFVQVSTDYVFYGDEGNYAEDAVPGPTRNYYALTKLVAEEAALSYRQSLTIRTSFRPRVWPYESAFYDLFTSQDYVDVIAPMVAEAVAAFLAGKVPYTLLHVATERKSVLELARQRAPAVRSASKESAGVALPDDVSLDVTRWRSLKESWGGAA